MARRTRHGVTSLTGKRFKTVSEEWGLYRDGKLLSTHPSSDAAHGQLHRIQGQSWDWAKKYEGYSITKAHVYRNPVGPRFKLRMAHRNVHAGTVRELELFIDNDEPTHRHLGFIIENMARKMAAGKFKPLLAGKLFSYLVDGAAARYDKEVSGGKGTVAGTFDKPTRDRVARMLAARYAREVRQGNWDIHLSRATGFKKYKRPTAWRRGS